MCEALRAVSLQRFGRQISIATAKTVTDVTEQLMLWLAPDGYS
jgi:hypothetical protein